MSRLLLIALMVIIASFPLLLETEEVTIPTESPIAYPFPGFTIVGVPVITPLVAEILNKRPDPFPVIL